MLKGIKSNVFLNNTELIPNNLINSAQQTVSYKDSISKKVSSSPKIQLNITQPTASITQKNQRAVITGHEKSIDSILARSEQREIKILAQKKITNLPIQTVTITEDTSSVRVVSTYAPLQTFHFSENEGYQQNIYCNIANKALSNNFDFSLLPSLNRSKEINKSQVIIKPIKKVIPGFEGKTKSESSIDWLPGIILLSLFTFSWMKAIYQKYILQVVYSLINYQASVRLLRERNVLFQNMALGLNFVFAVNTGLFVYFLFDYFKIQQIHTSSFLSFLLYAMLLVVLFYTKFLICKLIGFLFLVHEVFEEYIHNENLSNKNIGLLLFPVIILLPYVHENLRPWVIYSGIVIVSALFILRIIRGFQIIIRKEVSTFYLILYLCAIEILPLLILVKYLYTSI